MAASPTVWEVPNWILEGNMGVGKRGGAYVCGWVAVGTAVVLLGCVWAKATSG